MEQPVTLTFVYASVAVMALVIGYLIKRYVGGLDESIKRLNNSVDSIVKMLAQQEADHKIFNLKLEFQGEKIESHEERLDELESKVR